MPKDLLNRETNVGDYIVHFKWTKHNIKITKSIVESITPSGGLRLEKNKLVFSNYVVIPGGPIKEENKIINEIENNGEEL